MKITAPISRLEEIPLMAAAGADELYCGVIPDEWIARFNNGAVNRRFFGNLDGMEALNQAVSAAHAAQAKLFLVLNAQHYGPDRMDSLLDLAESFHSQGGDAVIVADSVLIMRLARDIPSLPVHVSSVATCRNSAGVAFYRDLGVRRVILPRDVTLDEIEGIASRAKDVEIEVFVLNDGCVFEEGVCHSVHLPTAQGGPLCIDPAPFEVVANDGEAISERLARRLRDHEADYKRWLWYRFGCGFSTTPEGYPYGPCGLCAIARLHATGVTSLKIAGREGATDRKLMSLELVRRVLDGVMAGATVEEAANLARGLRQAAAHCDSGYMCYYAGFAR